MLSDSTCYRYIWGLDEAAYDALRSLRRAVAERVLESLPPGWVITEASFDAQWYVPLCASPPALVDARTGEYSGVHPDCFVPPPFAVKVYASSRISAVGAGPGPGDGQDDDEEEVDDWEAVADDEEELEASLRKNLTLNSPPPDESTVEEGSCGLIHTLQEMGALPREYTPPRPGSPHTTPKNKGEYVWEIAQAVKAHLGISAAAACNVHSLFLHLMQAQLVSTREGDPAVATRDVIDALAYVQRRTDAEEEK